MSKRAVIAVGVVTLGAAGAIVAVAGVGESAADAGVRDVGWTAPGAGWALTGDALLVTADAGATWRDVTPPGLDAAGIRGAVFAGTGAGIAVAGPAGAGEAMAVWRTGDGGATWTVAGAGQAQPGDPDARGAPAAVSLSEDGSAVVVLPVASSANFSVGRMFRSADGGATWGEVTAPSRRIAAFTAGRGGVATAGPRGDRLVRTEDGGRTWNPVDGPWGAGALLSAPAVAPGGRVAVAVADGGAVRAYLSGDGGATWTPRGPAVDDTSGAAPLIDAAGDADTVATSRGRLAPVDGAAARVVAGLTPGDAVQTVAFAGPLSGALLVARSSCAAPKADCTVTRRLVATSDGGATWTDVTPR